jgi:hypothetical protein
LAFRRKGQQGILEYVLLMFFVLVVIIGLLFFLTWWQTVQMQAESRARDAKSVYSVMREMLNDPLLAKDGSVLDDSKLMALQGMGCAELEKAFGTGWHATARLFQGDSDVACTEANYPECNLWELCPGTGEGRCGRVSYALPVNIYRAIGSSAGIGLLEVWSCQ